MKIVGVTPFILFFMIYALHVVRFFNYLKIYIDV